MEKLDSKKYVWDDKFGMIEKPAVTCSFQNERGNCCINMPDTLEVCGHRGNEKECSCYREPINKKAIKIEGVGKDAEIVTNAKGGKQSKAPMAMHLLDPDYLISFARNKVEELEYLGGDDSTCVSDKDIREHRCYKAIEYVGTFMQTEDISFLQYAMDELKGEGIQQVMSIATVLQYGALRYKANNWRLIPQEEHINHALIHIIAHLVGDTQDNHLDHALCRLMMAYATKKSDDFDYGTFVDTNN